MSKSVTRLSRGRLVLTLTALVALSSVPANTALTTTTATTIFQGGAAVWNPDIAFDPVSQRYLAVFTYADQGPWGLFLTPDGVPDGGPFLMVGGYGEFARVAARTGGTGGFLVTYFFGGIKQAIYVRPGVPTILAGPLTLDTAVTYENDGSGLVYVPEYDRFLVTYPKGRHTWVTSVGGFTGNSADMFMTPPVGVTEQTGQCEEYLNRPEIAWDSATDRALVVGWRDFSECSAGGGIWRRVMSFDGTTIAPASNFTYLLTGGVQYDPKVVWSEAANKFILAWAQSPQFGVLQILKSTIDTNGNPSTIRTILPANLSNSSLADNAFGGQNQLGMAYNAATGRILLVARGNDNGITPEAPLFGLELDGNGDAIPFSLRELLVYLDPNTQLLTPLDAPRPFPVPVARPGSNTFLVLAKAGIPANARGELDLMTTIVTGDGGTGAGAWPLNSGTDFGAPGAPPPPPPPGGGSGPFTLTITRPTGGTILGPEIFCGDGGFNCAVTKPAGTVIELLALPSGDSPLSSWGGAGCGPVISLTSNLTCAPTFGAAPPPPPPPPPPGGGDATLSIVRPTGGTILGPEIFCGDGGSACSLTRPAGSVIELIAIPGTAPLSSWGGCAPTMTLNTSVTCTPVFGDAPPPPPPPPPPPGGGSGPFTLTIARVSGGTVLGPSLFCGDLGDACQVTLPAGQFVELAVIVSGGNTFTGWASCSSTFTMNSDLFCTPTYNGAPPPPAPPPPPPPGDAITLTIINPGTGGGGGFILGPEIACDPGETCTLTLSGPTTVGLTPIPYAGFSFAGWVGTGCANVMLVDSSRTCTADFNRN
jgi:hypothetical protein